MLKCLSWASLSAAASSACLSCSLFSSSLSRFFDCASAGCTFSKATINIKKAILSKFVFLFIYTTKVNRLTAVIIIICTVSLSNCRRRDTQHFVPNVQVNRNISTNLPQYNDLNFINGWVYLDGGYNGLLAFRANLEEVKVYDRQAPYNVIDQCRIYVDTNNSNIAIDTCSGSEWFLLDGQVLKGPASYPLKEYQTVFDGTNLTITN